MVDAAPNSALAVRNSAGAGAAGPVCGVLRIGAVRVALPIEVLREVIPCPTTFDGLPAAAPGLIGAVRLRGRVVPVLDLCSLLGLPAQQDDGRVIALLRHDGRLLGLLANAVCGLTSLAAGTLGAMEASSVGGLLFSGSFERADDDSAVSLLDPAALMRLPGLPLLRDAGEAAAEADEASQAADRPVLLVRCRDIGLAFEVRDVHATLPTVTLLPSSLDGALCRGVIEYAGLRVPAVDALALLELGALEPGESCQALLLKFGAGQVALLVGRVVDIVRVPMADLAPLSPLAVQRRDCFAGSVRIAGHGEHLLVAEGVLDQSTSLKALASLNTRVPDASTAGATAIRGGPPVATAEASGTEVITYDIGLEAATPLDQLIEVIAYPPDILRPERAHPATIGLFTHRGRGVTLFCLRALIDRSPAATAGAQPESARVLLVESAGARFGFVVPAVSHIDRALWERRPSVSADQPKHAASAPGQGLVEVQGNGRRRTLRLVDLQALARSLGGEPPTAATTDVRARETPLAVA